MATPPLACTVRDCGLPLTRVDGSWQCGRKHSFDIAKSGYINLLQPHDRRSLEAGDSRTALGARIRLLSAGIGRSILHGLIERAAALPCEEFATVVDLGCGAGEALGGLAAQRHISGIGIDLSTAAVDAAARRFPPLTWVVANADRRLPLLDQRVALVLSLHARRNPPESARVIEPGGHLLIAVPAADDLAELRAAVQGAATTRDRADAVIDAHRGHFSLIDRSVIRERVHAGPGELRDLLHGTYRGARRGIAMRADTLVAMDVTLASEYLLFARHHR